MAAAGVLVRIDQLAAQLTAAEAEAARFVSNHAAEVPTMAIAELARRSGTSEASVVRLCKKLHLKGYRELRLALAQDAGDTRIRTIHEDVQPDDGAGSIAAKVFASAGQALVDTLTIVDEDRLERCLGAMAAASSINFLGNGASGAVAEDAYFRFTKAGFVCYALTDASSQLTRVAALGPKDVVVAISHSGRSRDLNYAVRQARQRGAFAIGITQLGQQPLVEVCDVALFTSSRETAFRAEAMASRIAQHVLLDALFVGTALLDLETVTERLDAARAVTAHMRADVP